MNISKYTQPIKEKEIKIKKTYYDEFSPEEKMIFDEKMSLQMFITDIADIEYECYYEKISYGTFWKNKVAWHEILN